MDSLAKFLRDNGLEKYADIAEAKRLKMPGEQEQEQEEVVAALAMSVKDVLTFSKAVGRRALDTEKKEKEEFRKEKEEFRKLAEEEKEKRKLAEEEKEKLRKLADRYLGRSPMIIEDLSAYKKGMANRPKGTDCPSGQSVKDQIEEITELLTHHPFLPATFAAFCDPDEAALPYVDSLLEILQRTDADPASVHFCEHHPRPRAIELVRSMHIASSLREYVSSFEWPKQNGRIRIKSVAVEHQFVTLKLASCDVVCYASTRIPPIGPETSSSSSSGLTDSVPLSWPLSFTEVYLNSAEAEEKQNQADGSALNCLRLAPMELDPLVLGAALRVTNGVRLTLRAYRCASPEKAAVINLLDVSSSDREGTRKILAGYFSAQVAFMRNLLQAPATFLGQQGANRVVHLPEWDVGGSPLLGSGFIYKLFKSESATGLNLRIAGAQIFSLKSPDRTSIAVLRYPYIDGDENATSVEQVIAIVDVLDCAHKQAIVHGDIHPYNVIFAKKPQLSTFLDWDHSVDMKKIEQPSYHSTFLAGRTTWIDRYRHPAAKPMSEMSPSHDRYSLSRVLGDFEIADEKKQTHWQAALNDIADSKRSLQEIKEYLQQHLIGERLRRTTPVPKPSAYVASRTRKQSVSAERNPAPNPAGGTNSPLK